MRFLADMGVSPATVAFLRENGHDAIHLADEGLHRLPDPQILEKARAERRILLTHDLDFSDLVAVSGVRLPSVILFRLRAMRPKHVNHYLQETIAHQADALAQGAIVSITESQVRIRELPLRR